MEDRANYTPTDRGYAWRPPEAVPEGTKAEAVRLIAPMTAALMRAHPKLVGDWLARLGVLVAGNLTAADARIKIAAYAADLDFPALCFTDATRAQAGVAFKFFPTFSELSEFLSAVVRPHRVKLDRLRVIAGLPVEQKPRRQGWSDLTPAERLAHEAMMARLKQELADNEPIPKPIYPAI